MGARWLVSGVLTVALLAGMNWYAGRRTARVMEPAGLQVVLLRLAPVDTRGGDSALAARTGKPRLPARATAEPPPPAAAAASPAPAVEVAAAEFPALALSSVAAELPALAQSPVAAELPAPALSLVPLMRPVMDGAEALSLAPEPPATPADGVPGAGFSAAHRPEAPAPPAHRETAPPDAEVLPEALAVVQWKQPRRRVQGGLEGAMPPSAAPALPVEPPRSSARGALHGAEPGRVTPAVAGNPRPSSKAAPSARKGTALPAEGARTGIVAPRALDPGFRLLHPVRPRYPDHARRLKRMGMVVLELEVGTDGQVARIAVLQESKGWEFGEAARDAFATARFTPPTVNGRPVRVLWRKTLHFRP